MAAIATKKAAEAASLSRTGTAILKGHKVSVCFLPEGSSDLGYTSGDARKVFVAWEMSPYFDELSESEKATLRRGVFAHELLHQCLTNFAYTNKVCGEMTRAEAAIFMQFANTLEDPAIEYFAPDIFGGTLLEALRFSIRRIYTLSPGIDKSSNAFGQLINALIQFGDMGLIKGKFTFPEAKEAFKEVAPLYNEGITCSDSKKRIDIARKCMEITRPLWEEEVKNREFLEELLKALEELMKRAGLHLMEDEEKDMEDPSDSDSEGEPSPASARKSLLKKIKPPKKGSESEELDNMSSGGESADSSDEPESDSSSGSSSSSSSEPANDEDSEENANPSGSSSEQEKDKDDEEEGSGEGNNDADADAEDEDLTVGEEEANEMAEDVLPIDDEAIERINRQYEEDAKRAEREERKAESEGSRRNSTKPSVLPDYSISSSAFKSASCLNRMVRREGEAGGFLSQKYAEEKARYAREIKTLRKALAAIFDSDKEENHRATSGNYNIRRGSLGTTARIFDKRKDPGNLKDAAVMLCVDLSGSMSGTKVAQARKTCIIFAEALSALKIPYYIMGFHADFSGSDAVHDHFVDWRGRKADKESLVAMEARSNNFDGYSIRYAAELLKNTIQAENKLLIVISDGEPACAKYHSYRTGITDTINAIKDARKVCTTFGIALGDGCDPELLQSMYGRDFIFCEDETLLANVLGKKLQKLFKHS